MIGQIFFNDPNFAPYLVLGVEDGVASIVYLKPDGEPDLADVPLTTLNGTNGRCIPINKNDLRRCLQCAYEMDLIATAYEPLWNLYIEQLLNPVADETKKVLDQLLNKGTAIKTSLRLIIKSYLEE